MCTWSLSLLCPSPRSLCRQVETLLECVTLASHSSPVLVEPWQVMTGRTLRSAVRSTNPNGVLARSFCALGFLQTSARRMGGLVSSHSQSGVSLIRRSMWKDLNIVWLRSVAKSRGSMISSVVCTLFSRPDSLQYPSELTLRMATP